jgi:nucleoside phosphorylase
MATDHILTCTPSIYESDFTNDDYTVGWICALEAELAASQAMLDEEHPELPQAENDTNAYTLGQIGRHNVVLACLPLGTAGVSAAATVARDLLRSFPRVRFGLMVGVGGGAPSNDLRQDIRLGDVVVSTPKGNDGKGSGECIYLTKSELTKVTGGILQYDFGKTIKDGKFFQTGSLNKPPAVLMTGVSKLRALHLRKGSAIQKHVNSMLESNPVMQQRFSYRSPEDDQLFQAEYDHMDNDQDCKSCDQEHLVQRKPRPTNVPVIHYGLIGSANQVMRHGVTREKLRQERDIICFEMEAAGLMDSFPCLVIRGIGDYSDTHKNENWQPYAAATAAAYAKELLGVIPPVQVDKTPTAIDAIKVSLLHFPAYDNVVLMKLFCQTLGSLRENEQD